MQETDFIWSNGQLLNWNEASAHMLSHTLHYGSGVFEGIRAYNTDNGTAVFRLEEHIERLIFSANSMKLKLQYSKEQLIESVLQTLQANGLTEGYIRPLVFNGYGEMGIGAINKVEVIIACWPWPKYHEITTGLDVKTSKYRRIHQQSSIVEAKICGHYVNSILALQEIQGTKYHEALMLDTDGFVSECSAANIFIVKNNIIYTPGLGSILPGITRDFVIKLATDLGYKVIEQTLTLDDVYNADESFFTGTAVEVTLIRSLDDKLIGLDGVNPVAEIIKDGFAEAVYGKTPHYNQYLTYIK